MADIKSKLILDNTQFNKATKTSKKLIGGLGAGLKAVGGVAKTAAVGLVAAAGGLATIVTVSANTIDRLGKVAKVTGFAAETLQKFQFAAEQSGVTSDNAALALRRFARRLGEAQKGTGELLPALKKLGIETRDNEGRLKTAEEVLFEFADGLAKTKDSTARLALAFKAFDSEGAELVSVLKDGSAGLNEFFNEADRLGIILNTSAIAGVEKYNDELNKLKLVIFGVAKQLTAALAPALTTIATLLTDKIIDQFGDGEDAMEDFGKYLKDKLIVILQSVGKAFFELYKIIVKLFNKVIETLGMLGVINEVQSVNKEIRDLKELAADGGSWWNRFNFATGEAADILNEEFGGAFALTDKNIARAIEVLEKGKAKLISGGATDIGLIPMPTDETFDKFFNFLDQFTEKSIAANKAIADSTANDLLPSMTVVGKQLNSMLVRVLDSIFDRGRVDQFLTDFFDEAETVFDKLKAISALVFGPELVASLKEAFANSDIGDFTKTLTDGFVKAGQMLEDSLADAFLSGKADFSALGDHIKQVLAKALVQKLVTGPIMALFGLASGGPATAGQPYIVGEEGPELFIPKNSGTVIPNDVTAGLAGGAGIGGGTQVTYNINAVDARSFKQLVAQDPEFIFNVSQAGARRVPG